MERAARGGRRVCVPWGMASEMVPDYTTVEAGTTLVVCGKCFWLYILATYVPYTTTLQPGARGQIRRAEEAARGGLRGAASWRHHIKVTRTAARSSIPPEFQYADYGFRGSRSLVRMSECGRFIDSAPDALLVGVTGKPAAQQEAKPQDLPNAPVAKQEARRRSAKIIQHNHRSLGRRSIFFPILRPSRAR